MHNCDHKETEIRWRNRKAGLIGNQCLYCGCRVGDWLKHSDVENIESILAWIPDDEFTPVEGNELLSGEDEQPAVINTKTYNEYLNSDVWKARKNKILDRAGGLCEGCLSRKAEHVHHLTYRNIYHEFAFQLVALCAHCHARYHSAQGKR